VKNKRKSRTKIRNKNKMSRMRISNQLMKMIRIKMTKIRSRIKMISSKIRTNKIIRKEVSRSCPPSSPLKHNNSNSKA
jgi:hypothetical protein